ncbi:MAG TPA: multidrug effflux MFS transporter [Chthoniobacterales bacterium]
MAALAMLGPFSIDMIFPGFPAIARGFGASDVAMQQIVSVYLAAYAALSLFQGAISDAFGRKPVIVAGTLAYALASAGCAASSSLGLLLLSRAGQGLCAGVGMIVGRAIIRDLFEGVAAHRLMSQVTVIFGIAPAIAPIVGALLLGWTGWRGIFWALTAFATLLTLGCAVFLPESHPPERRRPFTLGPLWTSYRQIATDSPFAFLALAAAMNFGGLFLYIASAPAFVLKLLELSPAGFPWLFVPLIGGITLGAWVSGRLAGRLPLAQIVTFGYGTMASANLANVAVSSLLPHPAVPWSVLPLSLDALGFSLAAPALTLLALDRFPDQRGAASSVQACLALVTNALLAGLASPLLSGSAQELAAGMFALTLLGYGGWLAYCKQSKTINSIPTPLVQA